MSFWHHPRMAAKRYIVVAVLLAGCGPVGQPKPAKITPVEWMNAARVTVRSTCTSEADHSGATGQVWQNVYDACAVRVVVDLELHSTNRPAGTDCEVQPTWCRG